MNFDINKSEEKFVAKVYVEIAIRGIIDVNTDKEVVDLKAESDLSDIGTIGFQVTRIGSDKKKYELGILDGELISIENVPE